MDGKHPQVVEFDKWRKGFTGDAKLQSQLSETLYLAFSAGAEYGFNLAQEQSKAAPQKQQSFGLVNQLEREIISLAGEAADWRSSFHMYRTAWLREIGGRIVPKSHEIDGFVLRTRQLLSGVKNEL